MKCSGERQVDAASEESEPETNSTDSTSGCSESLSESQLLLLTCATRQSDLQGTTRTRSGPESQALLERISSVQSSRPLRVYESIPTLQTDCDTSVAFERSQKVHREARKTQKVSPHEDPTLCGPLLHRPFTVLRRRRSRLLHSCSKWASRAAAARSGRCHGSLCPS